MSLPFKQKPCKRCGAVFTLKSNHSLYCSPACKQRTATCGHCKRVFAVTKGADGKFCSLKCFYDFAVPVGSVRDGGNGYTITKVPPGTPGAKLAGRNRALWMWTHRYVMQQSLGRALLKTELVHHKTVLEMTIALKTLSFGSIHTRQAFGRRTIIVLGAAASVSGTWNGSGIFEV